MAATRILMAPSSWMRVLLGSVRDIASIYLSNVGSSRQFVVACNISSFDRRMRSTSLGRRRTMLVKERDLGPAVRGPFRARRAMQAAEFFGGKLRGSI